MSLRRLVKHQHGILDLKGESKERILATEHQQQQQQRQRQSPQQVIVMFLGKTKTQSFTSYRFIYRCIWQINPLTRSYL